MSFKMLTNVSLKINKTSIIMQVNLISKSFQQDQEAGFCYLMIPTRITFTNLENSVLYHWKVNRCLLH